MTEATHTGHCLCGAIRLEFSGRPLFVAHCHCNDCRRNTGAAVATFVGVKAAQLRWLSEPPAAFASSPGVRRTFCTACGGALTYEGNKFPGEVHINIGVLDRPGDFEPRAHVWASQKLGWLHLRDTAPRFPRMGKGDGDPSFDPEGLS